VLSLPRQGTPVERPAVVAPKLDRTLEIRLCTDEIIRVQSQEAAQRVALGIRLPQIDGKCRGGRSFGEPSHSVVDVRLQPVREFWRETACQGFLRIFESVVRSTELEPYGSAGLIDDGVTRVYVDDSTQLARRLPQSWQVSLLESLRHAQKARAEPAFESGGQIEVGLCELARHQADEAAHAVHQCIVDAARSSQLRFELIERPRRISLADSGEHIQCRAHAESTLLQDGREIGFRSEEVSGLLP